MRNRVAIAVLLSAGTLAGCAGGSGGAPASIAFNRHQCQDLDWNKAGLADGLKGYDDVAARLGSLDRACAKHGFGADQDAYYAGYSEGRRRAGG